MLPHAPSFPFAARALSLGHSVALPSAYSLFDAPAAPCMIRCCAAHRIFTALDRTRSIDTNYVAASFLHFATRTTQHNTPAARRSPKQTHKCTHCVTTQTPRAHCASRHCTHMHIHHTTATTLLQHGDDTQQVRIQYGGSVAPDNVDKLMSCPGNDALHP